MFWSCFCVPQKGRLLFRDKKFNGFQKISYDVTDNYIEAGAKPTNLSISSAEPRCKS